MIPETSDPKLNTVYKQVDEVKAVMAENMKKAIDRGERLDLLYDKSRELEQNSSLFVRQSTNLRRMMCMQNAKRTACVVFLILIIIGIIIGITYATKH